MEFQDLSIGIRAPGAHNSNFAHSILCLKTLNIVSEVSETEIDESAIELDLLCDLKLPLGMFEILNLT